jgi:hypothetical protein
MLVHLAAHIVSRNIGGDIVPGKAEAMQAMQQELDAVFDPSSITVSSADFQYGKVDDWWATFEWSSGGMVHVHIAFWIVASPRIDKIVMSSELDPVAKETIVLWDEDASVVLQDDAAAKVLTKFYDRVYTEWNPFKKASDEVSRVGVRRSIGKTVEKTQPAVDMISSATLIALLETDVKRALRLYEVAIVMGDLIAMELAYDLYYDENIINRQVNSYTDKERAMELREMMVSKNYSGGMLRLALDYLENPEFVTEISKKKEACRIIKANVDNKLLSITSKKIVDENKSSLTCRVL